MILTIFFVLLLTVSVVSATDNTTNNVVGVEETNDEIVSIDNNHESSIEIINEDSNNLNDSVESICSIENDNVIAFENDENNLSDSAQYSVSNFGVSPDSINYGSSGSVSFILVPINNNPYEYHLKLEVINSNGESKKSWDVDGNTFGLDPALYNTKRFSYVFGPNDFGPGQYTARLTNTDNFRILASCSFTINSVPYSEYTVSVKDTTINYEYDGTITMTISPTQGMYSRYDFYLKVYDSNNKEKISKRYAEENVNTHSVSYTIGAKTLNPGEYTIKIINAANTNQIFDTAKLSVKYSDYSVKINNVNMNYWSSGTITMAISPVSANEYNYNFYLQVLDSNNELKISKKYVGTGNGNRSISHTIDSNLLDVGIYTIKIITVEDNIVKTTAKLTVNSVPYSAYTVTVDNVSMNYGSNGIITMSISPANSYYYKYDFYLKVYNLNGVEVIKNRYRSTSVSNSLIYSIESNTLDPGIYTIKIINAGDNHIFDTAKLTVKSLPASAYSVSVNDMNMDYWEESSISMSISPSNGYYYKYDFYLKVYNPNGVEIIKNRYNSTSFSDSVTYNIKATTLNPGVYAIKIINTYDSQLMSNANLTVNSLSYSSAYSVSVDHVDLYYNSTGLIPILISPASSKYYQYDFYFNVYDDTNYVKKISKRFHSDTIDTSSKTLTYTIDAKSLSPGEYTIKIINVEDNESMGSAFLTVSNLMPTICSSELTKDGNWLIVSLKDYLGNPIRGVNLSTTNDFYGYNFPTNEYGLVTLTTNEYGQVKFPVSNLKPGNHFIFVVFNGNDLYQKLNEHLFFTIEKIPTHIVAPPVSTVYNGGKYLVATLKDNSGNIINGGGFYITLKETWVVGTDSNGRAKLTTNGLTPKVYTATIIFYGDDYYEYSYITVKVTVKKATPKLTTPKKTFKKSVKTKKYTVTLKDNVGKALKNTKVTIKVNKKTYTAKTNSKGVATFKITKLTKKGKYTATVTYKGSSYYNKLTKKVKIIIK